ncbi:MAG: hypothetical protein V4669_19870 [Pseudomonadota bacterium]
MSGSTTTTPGSTADTTSMGGPGTGSTAGPGTTTAPGSENNGASPTPGVTGSMSGTGTTTR